MREASYSTMRLGLYEPIKKALGETDPATTPTSIRYTASCLSGLFASVFANPVDLIKARMQAEPAGVNHNLRWHINDIHRSQGGFKGFYRGWHANILRAVIANSAIVGTYDTTKQAFKNYGFLNEGLSLYVTCSFIAAMFASAFACPADNLKTRLMTENCNLPRSRNNPRYDGLFDCAR